MLSLDATQQAIVASDYKLVSWLFEVTTLTPTYYYWSTKAKTYNSHVYEDGIIWDTGNVWDSNIVWADAGRGGSSTNFEYKINFDGITLSKSNSEYGIQSPNDLNFTIHNKDSVLNADGFIGATILLKLILSDGTDEETIRIWKFKIQKAEAYSQIINLYCTDFIQEHIEGDYPNTRLISDIIPSDDGVPDDTLCVPIPFGTCYIPLRSLYIVDARYYVLGLAKHSYDIYKVRSPRDWGNTSEWTSDDYDFIQSTKLIDGVYWRVFQPIIADSDNDGVVDACGLWKSGDVFLDPLVQFSRDDNEIRTNPSDVIQFILEDLGISRDDIDTTSFATARTTYVSWGLTFNGAFFYKKTREESLAMLLNMCHSVLIPREKLELHVLSKTSQQTLNKSHILQGSRGASSFGCNLVTQEKSDSGYIGYQVIDMPQDNLIKALVPAKDTTDEILDETLDVSWINDSQDAQRAGSLYYQRRLLKKSDTHFDTKGTLLALDPDDMITIDHSDYGGTYDVIINTININRDALLNYTCNRYSDDLDDWDDLTPDAVTIATDDTTSAWTGVTYGPSSSVSSGAVPNQIGSGFYVGKTDFWGGDSSINNSSTKIVLGDLDGVPKIALGANADAITYEGEEPGFYADGNGNVRLGDSSGYIRFAPGTTMEARGLVTASEIHIPDKTTADSFHVATDADTWWGCTETAFDADNDNAPTYVLSTGAGKITLLNEGLRIQDTDASHDLIIKPLSDLSDDRTLSISTGDTDRIVTISGNPTLDDWFDQSLKTTFAPTFGGLTIGDGINYATFASDGELTLVGTARVIKDLWLPTGALKAPGSKPATEIEHGLASAWEFADAIEANQESISGAMRTPTDMDRTVGCSMLIGWGANGVSPGNCKWQLEYSWNSPDDDLTAAAQETLTVVSTASSTSNGLTIGEFTGITAAGADVACIRFRITRLSADVQDTITDTTECIGVCACYTSNCLGEST